MAEAIATLIPIVLILAVAGVLILRPLSKRLGMLLEAYGQDRLAARTDERQMEAIRDSLEGLDRRLDVLEERLGFTEELVGRRTPRDVTGARDGDAEVAPAPRLAAGGD